MRIPQEEAAAMGLTEGSEVSLNLKGKALTIQRMQRTFTLDELLDGVTPENSGGEIDSGAPRGREVW